MIFIILDIYIYKYIYMCEIADIVDNISVGLKCRGNNNKRHKKMVVSFRVYSQTHHQTLK